MTKKKIKKPTMTSKNGEITYLISGSGESPQLKSMGIMSSLPEKRNSDIISLLPNSLMLLFQRKTIVDFIRSLRDGRLSKDMAKTTEDELRFLIFEGKPRYDKSGYLLMPHRRGRRTYWKPTGFKEEHLKKMLFSIRYVHGVEVLPTRDLDDTILTVKMLSEYLSKENHEGFLQRPKAQGGDWGRPSEEERKLHFLQGLPGVGVGIAKSLLDAGSGNIPMQWVMTLDELRAVPRISKARAEKLWEFIPRWEAV